MNNDDNGDDVNTGETDDDDNDSHNIIEGAARSKVSRSSSAATETMGLNGTIGLYSKSKQSILINCLLYGNILLLTIKLIL